MNDEEVHYYNDVVCVCVCFFLLTGVERIDEVLPAVQSLTDRHR